MPHLAGQVDRIWQVDHKLIPVVRQHRDAPLRLLVVLMTIRSDSVAVAVDHLRLGERGEGLGRCRRASLARVDLGVHLKSAQVVSIGGQLREVRIGCLGDLK